MRLFGIDLRNPSKLLISAFLLYFVSLSLPGIVYRPNIRLNDNFDYCSKHATAGSEGPMPYCADYATPIASKLSGYEILAKGHQGLLIGVFAWYANLAGAIALLLALTSLNKGGLFFAGSSIFLGLTSFSFHKQPLDEGGVSYLYVDHLGVGFYLWELSFVLLTIYFIKRIEDKKAETAD